MSTDAPAKVKPSATPSPEDVAAWDRMTRDEQAQALRAVFTDPASTRASETTMTELLVEARARSAARHG